MKQICIFLLMHLHFTGWSHPSPGRNALRMVWVQSEQEQFLILCSHTVGAAHREPAAHASCSGGLLLTVGATSLAHHALPAACAVQNTAAQISSIRKHPNSCQPPNLHPLCPLPWLVALLLIQGGWEGAPWLLVTPVCHL